MRITMIDITEVKVSLIMCEVIPDGRPTCCPSKSMTVPDFMTICISRHLLSSFHFSTSSCTFLLPSAVCWDTVGSQDVHSRNKDKVQGTLIHAPVMLRSLAVTDEAALNP